jgi:histidinol-phosphate aminotransferase
MLFRSVIDLLQPYDAGAFPDHLREKYNVPERHIVNLGSNENPYPPPEKVMEAITEEASLANRYPEPSYQRLKEKLSEYTSLPVENIVVGNGANDVLDIICKITLEPFDRVVIPVPTYTMYIFLSMLRDASLDFIQMKEPDFNITADEVVDSAKGATLILLSSPNNPTGKTIRREDLVKIAEETEALVVVDEAYYEYCGKTMADKVVEYENLVVVRTFSKFFGLAGLRVGYALCNDRIATMLEKARLPFNLNRIAQKAAIAALEEKAWFNRIKGEILRERESVIQQLNKIKGLEPLSSEANFLLVKLPSIDMQKFTEELNKEGIIIRDVTGLHGLKNNYMRVTIGKKEENRKLLSGLQNFFTTA